MPEYVVLRGLTAHIIDLEYFDDMVPLRKPVATALVPNGRDLHTVVCGR